MLSSLPRLTAFLIVCLMWGNVPLDARSLEGHQGSAAGTPANVVRNGDFSDGRSDWRFYSNGVATFTVTQGEARVSIATPGSNVQLHQRDLQLEGNTEYRLRFRARNTGGERLVVRLFKHTAPYTSYGLSKSFSLTPADTAYEVSFRTTTGNKTDARLMFWMGNRDDTYYIDDVVLEADGGVASCGDGIVDPGEQCDDGNAAPGDGCSASCRHEVCGNGVIDPGEQCDDGNTAPGDGCSPTCRQETCGNGVIETGEQCDDGNTTPGDGCSPTCRQEVCGNGVVDPGEQCDDGNTTDDDGCSNGCTIGTATNLIVNGDFSSGTGPWIFYTNGAGAYGIVGGEARLSFTSDGTNVQLYQRRIEADPLTDYRLTFRARHSLAGKRVTVRFGKHTAPYTSYGLSQRVTLTTSMQTYTFEFTTTSHDITDGRLTFLLPDADVPGSTIHLDDVELALAAPPTPSNCGNGTIDAGESCDGTNLDGETCETQGFDGGALACNATCDGFVTGGCFGCGDGTINGTETCDGADLDGQTCQTQGFDAGSLSCTASCDGFVTTGCSVCGDGIVGAGEGCDDGNLVDGDGCSATCTPEAACGNGTLDPGEACDDGNLVNGDGCSALCTQEPDGDPTVPNVVANGDFSEGRDEWTFYTNGSGTFATVAGEGRIVIAAPGSNVQLFQHGLTLDGDTLYRIRFRARNTGGDNVTVRLQQHASPNANFGLDRSFNLTPSDGSFTHEFRTTPGDKIDARLMFWIANKRHTFYFDDIAIERVSDLVDDQDPPSVPTDVTATALASTSIRTDWTAATDNVGVTGYRVLRNGSTVEITTSTSFVDTGLQPNTAYGYSISAFDADGNESAASPPASATTPPPDAVPPTTPGSFTAAVISSTRIDLSWTASSDNVAVSGYTIKRRGSTIARTTNTSHRDEGLLQGTAYDYEVIAVDREGNASAAAVTAATTPANPQATFIDPWYGDVQAFGSLGTPQNWINVVGNASDPAGLRELSFSLNGGAYRPLTIGPDDLRLEEDGDFNVEIAVDDLLDGLNSIMIRAVDDQSSVTERSVIVDYGRDNVWPLPYSIDWSNVTNVQDAVQVVDGLWTVDSDGVRPVLTGYDRLLAIGDRQWTNYEIQYSFTVHRSHTGGTGMIMGWLGHTDSPLQCPQPHCGWQPSGNSVWYSWSFSGGEPHDFGGTLIDPTGRMLFAGVRYFIKAREETAPNGDKVHAFKIWAEGESEPADWTDTGPGDRSAPRGSILLIAHELDITFHDLEVVPLSATDTPPARRVSE